MKTLETITWELGIFALVAGVLSLAALCYGLPVAAALPAAVLAWFWLR